jgi:hypothetical protein
MEDSTFQLYLFRSTEDQNEVASLSVIDVLDGGVPMDSWGEEMNLEAISNDGGNTWINVD